MNKTFKSILVFLILHIAASALAASVKKPPMNLPGNEGGNGGHSTEQLWKTRSNEIIKAVDKLIFSENVPSLSIEILIARSTLVIDASDAYSKSRINIRNNTVEVDSTSFNKKSEKEKTCEVLDVMYSEQTLFDYQSYFSCEEVHNLIMLIEKRENFLNSYEMEQICKEPLSQQKSSYKCMSGQKQVHVKADNIIEALKRSSVKIDPIVCIGLNNSDFTVIMEPIFYSYNMECKRVD